MGSHAQGVCVFHAVYLEHENIEKISVIIENQKESSWVGIGKVPNQGLSRGNVLSYSITLKRNFNNRA